MAHFPHDATTHATRGSRRDRALLIGSLLLIGLGNLAGIVTEAGLEWDFANFYDAGHKFRVGQAEDIYRGGVDIDGQPPAGDMAFLGTPLSSAFYAPLSLMPPRLALLVFKIENALAYLAGLLLLYHSYRRFDRGETLRFAALFAFAALLYQPFWTIYRVGGQTTPTCFLLLVLALAAFLDGRRGPCAMLLALAVTIKPVLAPPLLLLALLSGWPFFLWTVVWGGILFGLSLLLLGWELHAELLRQIGIESTKYTPWYHNSALVMPLENLRALTGPEGPWSAATDGWIRRGTLVLRVAAAAPFAWLAWSTRRAALPLPARRHLRFCLALIAGLMFAPVVWEHYLVFLFIPLAYLVALRRFLPVRARRLLVAVFALASLQNVILVHFAAHRLAVDEWPTLVLAGLLKSAPLILMLVLFWRYREPWMRTYSDDGWNSASL